MFKDIKGGHVMLSVGGKVKTVNIATHPQTEMLLYAKTNGNWYTALNANGTTLSGYGWKHLHLPATHNLIPSSSTGRVQVECVATKVRKRIVGV